MLEKALIDLAALAAIAQFALDLWRGGKRARKTLTTKRTASSWNC